MQRPSKKRGSQGEKKIERVTLGGNESRKKGLRSCGGGAPSRNGQTEEIWVPASNCKGSRVRGGGKNKQKRRLVIIEEPDCSGNVCASEYRIFVRKLNW